MFDQAMRSGVALDAETVCDVRALVLPRPEEMSWQGIPWQTSIPEAVRLGRQEGKPVLLWAMNGNPLGLT